MISLTNVGTLHTDFQDWLLTKSAKRYHHLTTEDERVWLEQVLQLALTRRIMLMKYEEWTVRYQPAFADPQVALALSVILAEHDRWRETARLLHHIVRDTTLRENLGEQIQTIYGTLPPLPLPLQVDSTLLAIEPALDKREE